MNKHPLGFLSYVRADDDHDCGRLTELRERLKGEVNAQTGEHFHIFQDRNDIGWGQTWKERVNDSLDAVTFLICIITPRYFKSDACREELARFVAREKALGRADLILPVYYIDCPVLEDEARRAADPLAELISTRNYVDWRKLRFEAIDSPEVNRMLARLATSIRMALEARFA